MTPLSGFCDYVQDGDTFKFRHGTWVRLARVDTPELGTEEGERAKSLLSYKILNKDALYDITATGYYGRPLVEVWVDGINVNDYMISLGWGC